MKALLFIIAVLAGAMTLASCDESEEPAAQQSTAVTEHAAPPPSRAEPAAERRTQPEKDVTVDVTGPEGRLPDVAVREAMPSTMEPLPEAEVTAGEPIRTAAGSNGLAVDLLRAEVNQDTYFVALRYRNPGDRELQLVINPSNASYTAPQDRQVSAQAVFPADGTVVVPAGGSAVVQVRFPPPGDDVAAVDLDVFGVGFDDVLVNRP